MSIIIKIRLVILFAKVLSKSQSFGSRQHLKDKVQGASKLTCTHGTSALRDSVCRHAYTSFTQQIYSHVSVYVYAWLAENPVSVGTVKCLSLIDLSLMRRSNLWRLTEGLRGIVSRLYQNKPPRTKPLTGPANTTRQHSAKQKKTPRNTQCTTYKSVSFPWNKTRRLTHSTPTTLSGRYLAGMCNA